MYSVDMKTVRVRVLFLCILLVSLLTRMAYANLKPEVSVYPDSLGYYHIGQTMFAHPSIKTIINPYRTPGYPAFLLTVAQITGRQSMDISDPAFTPTLRVIATIQSLLAIISISVLFFTMLRLNIKPIFSAVFCLIHAA